MPKRLDLTGQRYGRLVVMGMDWTGRKTKALCKCECGLCSMVLTYNLLNGNTTSCGCAAKEIAAERGSVVAPLMGETEEALAEAFDTTPSNVHHVVSGKTWIRS